MSPTPGVRSVATLMVLSSISLFLFLSLLLVSDKVLHKASTERLQSFLYTAALRTSVYDFQPASFLCFLLYGSRWSSVVLFFFCLWVPRSWQSSVRSCRSTLPIIFHLLFYISFSSFFFLSSISLTPQKLSRDDTHVLKQLEEPSRLILIPAFLNT